MRRLLVLGAVLVTLLAAGWAVARDRTHTAVVYFPTAKGLYVGDDVQVLGVAVGEVTRIRPEPRRVRVELAYRADRPVPADVTAVLVAPTLISVRHVALTPVYRGGATLPDGATIPEARAVVPVEWDDIRAQLDVLARALGPDGADARGSLGRLVEVSAANLRGNGAKLGRTLRLLARATATLAESREDLFATVRNLQVFVTALQESDAVVYDLNRELASVSALLARDRAALAAALDGLDRAFAHVERFLRENRGRLRAATADLTRVTGVLARNRQSLADALHVIPTALSNFYNLYDPTSSALAGQLAIGLQSPAGFVCSALLSLGGTPQQCKQAVAPLAELLSNDGPPVGVGPVQRSGRGRGVQPRGAGRGTPPPGPGQAAPPRGGLGDLLLPGTPR
jgi:phospholipid/cholesterol/gamma-HCH transport system substrate-binding protein